MVGAKGHCKLHNAWTPQALVKHDEYFLHCCNTWRVVTFIFYQTGSFCSNVSPEEVYNLACVYVTASLCHLLFFAVLRVLISTIEFYQTVGFIVSVIWKLLFLSVDNTPADYSKSANGTVREVYFHYLLAFVEKLYQGKKVLAYEDRWF